MGRTEGDEGTDPFTVNASAYFVQIQAEATLKISEQLLQEMPEKDRLLFLIESHKATAETLETESRSLKLLKEAGASPETIGIMEKILAVQQEHNNILGDALAQILDNNG